MQKKISKKKVFEYIFKLSKPFYLNLIIVLFVVIIDSFLNAFNPYILKIIINAVSKVKINLPFQKLFFPIALFIGSKLLTEIIWRIHNYVYLGKMLPQFRQNLIKYNFTQLLNQSYSFYENEYSGKLSFNILRLAKYIPDIISTVLERFLNQILTIIISFYFLSKTNIKYSLLLLCLFFLFILLILIFNNTLTERSKRLGESYSKSSGQITDIFANILPVKLFSNIKQEQQEIKNITDNAKTNEKKVFDSYFIFVTIAALVIVSFEVIALILLILDWQNNKVGLGDFGFIIFLNSSITHMLWYNLRIVSDFTQTLGETQQILSYIFAPIKLKDIPDANKIEVHKGKVEFKNISFKYDANSEYIFRNFSLSIKQKEKIGIVGYSGGGKSTLIKLLLRMYDVNNGEILIDDHNIAKVTQESLRENIGLIPQESTLFHRSVMENIKYGNKKTKQEDIYEAAKKAYAHSFIEKLPNKYDSLVGERGVKISGGQKQRIAIARIILKNAPILILDEATSALDSMTEKSIQNAIDYLMKDKTTIIIAHRLSTLQKMDKIIVLDNGKIVEEGSHKNLLTHNGLYKKLWNTQINGFISDDIT